MAIVEGMNDTQARKQKKALEDKNPDEREDNFSAREHGE